MGEDGELGEVGERGEVGEGAKRVRRVKRERRVMQADVNRCKAMQGDARRGCALFLSYRSSFSLSFLFLFRAHRWRRKIEGGFENSFFNPINQSRMGENLCGWMRMDSNENSRRGAETQSCGAERRPRAEGAVPLKLEAFCTVHWEGMPVAVGGRLRN
jgi:hypothetical protein